MDNASIIHYQNFLIQMIHYPKKKIVHFSALVKQTQFVFQNLDDFLNAMNQEQQFFFLAHLDLWNDYNEISTNLFISTHLLIYLQKIDLSAFNLIQILVPIGGSIDL